MFRKLHNVVLDDVRLQVAFVGPSGDRRPTVPAWQQSVTMIVLFPAFGCPRGVGAIF